MLSGVLTAFKPISQNLTNQPQALHLTRSFPLASTLPRPFPYPVPHGYLFLLLYGKCQSASMPPIQMFSCSKAEELYTLNQPLWALNHRLLLKVVLF